MEKNSSEEQNKKLINPISEYLDNRNHTSDFIDLFEAEKHNVDLRTDLSHEEIILVNIIKMNASFLQNKGLNNNIFDSFIDQYLRLKISLERKSRGEFVDINKRDRTENHLKQLNSFAELRKTKE